MGDNVIKLFINFGETVVFYYNEKKSFLKICMNIKYFTIGYTILLNFVHMNRKGM